MTVNEYVHHRMQFPVMRKIATAVAIVANAGSAAYLQAQEPAEEPVSDELPTGPIGMYL